MIKYTRYLGLVFMVVLFSCRKSEEARVQRKDIIDAVFASGNIINTNEYLVEANTDGYLEQSFVSEGDTAFKSKPLFRLSNLVQVSQVANAAVNYDYAKIKSAANAPQIEQVKVQIVQAKQQCSTDSINFGRYQRLLKTQAVSQVDYDKVKLQFESDKDNIKVLEHQLADLQLNLALNRENAKSQLAIQEQNYRYNYLSAAINGVVLSVSKKQGDYVKKGDIIARIGAGKLLAKLFISEDDIDRVKLGQSLLISLNTDKLKSYKAILTKIYPSFDTDQQSFIAEASFTEMPAILKANTQLQANIIVTEKKNTLVIPTNYLDKNHQVELKEGDKKVEVQTGISNLDWTEIISGLQENDRILLSKQ